MGTVPNSKSFRNDYMHSNGTTPYDTIMAIFPSVIYPFVGSTMSSLVLSFFTNNKRFIFIVEFVFTVLLTVLHITVLADRMGELLLTSISALIWIILFICLSRTRKIRPKIEPTKPYVTNFRAACSLSTAIAILAVDFRIFPRRFAKTETFGYSLMDVGVGLYMFANGLVASELKGQRNSFKKTFKSIIPLLVLGGARFVITKQSDYTVPVSEYGVHWNFFITLAVTKLLTTFILNVINLKYIIFNAIALIAAHEALLQSGLQNFVLNTQKRDTFITANREGLVSSLGYVSLYLFSVYFGYLLDVRKTDTNKTRNILKMAGLSVLLYMTSFVCDKNFGISRRLANAAFCFWILSISNLMNCIAAVMEIVQDTVYARKLPHVVYTSYIFEAINYNALPFFLFSNILTGLINLSVDTLQLNMPCSLAIILVYMIINCLIVSVLYEKKIKLQM